MNKQCHIKNKYHQISSPLILDHLWESVPPIPNKRYDAAGVQIGNRLFVIGGYSNLDEVIDFMDILDLDKCIWVERVSLPSGMAHSHQALATDRERYIYIVSGQIGAQCRPATRNSFVYDIQEKKWSPFQPLPAPRYAATMQLWRGRLHVVGGSMPDRYSPANDHWSIGVDGVRVTDKEWKKEAPIPRGTTHHTSAIVEDKFYVIGGQQGDYTAIPGDPDCKCTHMTQEYYFPDTYSIGHGEKEWNRLRSMPVACSHIDYTAIVIGNSIVVAGGQIFKDPKNFELKLTDLIQAYDTAADKWTVIGRLPYRVKNPSVAYHNGKFFFSSGQRDCSPFDDRTGEIMDLSWCVSLHEETRQVPIKPLLSCLTGKRIVLISHDLSRTGAPLLLVETAAEMMRSGAEVYLSTLADDAYPGNIAEQNGITILPLVQSLERSAEADLVIANTAVVKTWINRFLNLFPQMHEKLVWWIHENDTDLYSQNMEDIGRVAACIFDSQDSLTAWKDHGFIFPAVSKVVYPGIDDKFMAKAEMSSQVKLTRDKTREDLGLNTSDFLVTAIGAGPSQKGFFHFIKAVGMLMDKYPALGLKALLIGFNKLEKEEFLKNLSAGSRRAVTSDRVLLKDLELFPYYAASDVFVMNSQVRGENFGRVTIEAMAFKLPVLGTSAGGTKEIVVDMVTGMLHPVGDEGIEKLAGNIQRLMNDREVASRMGRAGYKRVKELFSSNIFYNNLNSIFEHIINDHSPMRLAEEIESLLANEKMIKGFGANGFDFTEAAYGGGIFKNIENTSNPLSLDYSQFLIKNLLYSLGNLKAAIRSKDIHTRNLYRIIKDKDIKILALECSLNEIELSLSYRVSKIIIPPLAIIRDYLKKMLIFLLKPRFF